MYMAEEFRMWVDVQTRALRSSEFTINRQTLYLKLKWRRFMHNHDSDQGQPCFNIQIKPVGTFNTNMYELWRHPYGSHVHGIFSTEKWDWRYSLLSFEWQFCTFSILCSYFYNIYIYIYSKKFEIVFSLNFKDNKRFPCLHNIRLSYSI